MIVLVGASASGKTELSKILFDKFHYHKCITTTTRSIRNGETQDKDYHFLDKETFLKLQAEGAFYEVSLYQEYLYGIQKKDVDLNGLVIVDPNGANALSMDASHIFVCFIEASEHLRILRMQKRGDAEVIIQKRIAGDKQTFQKILLNKIDLVVRNEDKDLEELAILIHEAYQYFIQKQTAHS